MRDVDPAISSAYKATHLAMFREDSGAIATAIDDLMNALCVEQAVCMQCGHHWWVHLSDTENYHCIWTGCECKRDGSLSS